MLLRVVNRALALFFILSKPNASIPIDRKQFSVVNCLYTVKVEREIAP
jgi:hypothetical protein